MSEKRRNIASFLLKSGGKSFKVELFNADQWKDGDSGCVRLRVNGRWHNQPDGSRCWMDVEDVGAFVARLLLTDNGKIPLPRTVPERPTVRRAQPVSMPGGPFTRNGEPLGSVLGRIACDDALLGSDGRWYVIASGGTQSLHFVAYDELTFLPTH